MLYRQSVAVFFSYSTHLPEYMSWQSLSSSFSRLFSLTIGHVSLSPSTLCSPPPTFIDTVLPLSLCLPCTPSYSLSPSIVSHCPPPFLHLHLHNNAISLFPHSGRWPLSFDPLSPHRLPPPIKSSAPAHPPSLWTQLLTSSEQKPNQKKNNSKWPELEKDLDLLSQWSFPQVTYF